MRGRRISPEELRRQIEEDGEEFGIVAMDSVFGDVLAAEDILTVLPLVPGVNEVEDVRRDICSVSQEYPVAAVIGSRKKKNERSFYHRAEIAQMADRRVHEIKQEAAVHEMKGDARAMDRGRIMVSVRR